MGWVVMAVQVIFILSLAGSLGITIVVDIGEAGWVWRLGWDNLVSLGLLGWDNLVIMAVLVSLSLAGSLVIMFTNIGIS